MLALFLALSLASASPRLADPVRPASLAVELDVHPDRDDFTGRATLEIDVLEATKSFHLHGEELVVKAVSLRGPKKALAVTATPVDGGRLRIDAKARLKPGRYALVIDYVAKVHEQPYGLYRFESEGQKYLVTQLEADDARTVWPCFDEPAFKVPFELSVRTDLALKVITNEAPTAIDAVGELKTVRFAKTQPIPTYAGALALGPFDEVLVSGAGVPSTIYVPKGHGALAEASAEEIPRIVRSLEGWFGEPYPYTKLDLIAATDFAYGAMENPGAIVISEQILYPAERATPQSLENLSEVLAHEIGHHWFGDLVTMAWWDDFWLNESFAEWIAGRTVMELHPELRRDLGEVRSTQWMIRGDGSATARPLRTEIDPAAVFETANFAVYPKGQALLTMVEAWMGREAFQKGVRTYLSEHRWGNATSKDLFSALSKAGGVDIGPVMTGFLDEPGAPIIAFDQGRATQGRFTTLGAGELPFKPWKIPLHLRVGRRDGTSALVDVVLDAPTADLGLGDYAWVLPTAEGVGYYAWDLPDAGWEALLAAAPGLDARDQIVLLGEIDVLVSSGRRDAGWALGVVGRFRGSKDPEVLKAAVALAWRVNVAKHLQDEALGAQAEAWTRRTLAPWLETVGMKPRAGEGPDVAELRLSLLAALADAEEPAVLAFAESQAQAWLADAKSVNPQIGPWAVGAWIKAAPRSQSQVMLDRSAKAMDPGDKMQFLIWSAAVRDPAVTRSSLALALSPEMGFQETFSLLSGVMMAHEGDETFVPEWVMANYDVLAAKLPPQFRMFMASFGGGCDLERFEKTKGFFLDPARAVPGTEQVVAETEGRVRECVAGRETHGASVRRFLEAQPVGR